MARYTGPKCRRCRRAGVKLFLKGDKCINNCPMDRERRSIPPGIHRYRGKQSEFAVQLQEKQKLRYIFGLTEASLRRLVRIAESQPGVTGHTLLRLLERRLDTVIHRSGMASSRNQARQWITHGHFLVNQHPVRSPFYLLKEGDVVALKATSKLRNPVLESLKRSQDMGRFPPWVEVLPDALSIRFLRPPERDEVHQDIQDRLVIEYYTR